MARQGPRTSPGQPRRPVTPRPNRSDSNLVKALRGELPFGKDLGVAGAPLACMPARRDPVPGL